MQEDPQIRKFYLFIFLFVFVFEMSVAEFLTRLLQLHEKFARDEKFTYESLFCLCWSFTAQSTTRSYRAGQLIGTVPGQT